MIHFNSRRIFFFLLFLPLALHAAEKKLTDEAQHIFSQKQSQVFQIRVIDLASGKKNSTGSGFVFSPQGHIATNYHVISEAYQDPSRFRIEYVKEDGAVVDASLVDIDVVHDLAVLKSEEEFKGYFQLGEGAVSKGTQIFSLGNPYDLGMTIIEGTYNGLMEKSLYRKILFSGSLNSGMSGGPAVNHDSQIIGVNVATMGNQVSFLVPVEFLKAIYDRILTRSSAPFNDRHKYIESQLVDYQNEYLNKLNSSSWDTLPFGEALVPGEISRAMKCWGRSYDKDENLFSKTFLSCSTEDEIFISPELTTGKINFQYSWLKSKGLNPLRFYNLYQRYFNNPYEFNNAEDKEEMGNFICHPGFVKIDGQNWKMSMCARNYKKYPQLYDLSLVLASLNAWDTGLVVDVKALGLTRPLVEDFLKKFLGEIKWQK